MQIIQFSDWNISYLYLILFTFFLIIESYSLEPITAKGFNNVIVLCFFGNLLKPFSASLNISILETSSKKQQLHQSFRMLSSQNLNIYYYMQVP